jgi:hypothetical protein
MALSFDDLPDEAPAAVLAAQAEPVAGGLSFDDLPEAAPQANLPDRTADQWVTDIGGSVGRGAYNLFDSLAGLGDIATGGEVTPWLARHGLNSKAARQVLDDEMSPQAKAQRDEVVNAQGFGSTIAALLQNPAYAAGQVVESVPTMVVGGAAGKGAALGAKALGMNAGRAALVGAGTGEGLATAGQQAANTVQQTGDLTLGQTAAALGAGGLTGLIGAGSAGLGNRLGAGDIDAMLSGAAGPAAGRNMLARMGIGAGMETGEEALQSSQEQIMQNAALGNRLPKVSEMPPVKARCWVGLWGRQADCAARPLLVRSQPRCHSPCNNSKACHSRPRRPCRRQPQQRARPRPHHRRPQRLPLRSQAVGTSVPCSNQWAWVRRRWIRAWTCCATLSQISKRLVEAPSVGRKPGGSRH